jgi:regulatory protein YycI of two-component signal transduction system YycFG
MGLVVPEMLAKKTLWEGEKRERDKKNEIRGDEYLKEMAPDGMRSVGKQQHWRGDNIDAKMEDVLIR